jgi:hypothetical protein
MCESELLSLLRSIGQNLARIADAVSPMPPPRIDVEQTYRRQMTAPHIRVNAWPAASARPTTADLPARPTGSLPWFMSGTRTWPRLRRQP